MCRMTPDTIEALRINDTNKVLEVKVYRAWIHWDPPNTAEKGFRAILLDKQVLCIWYTTTIIKYIFKEIL